MTQKLFKMNLSKDTCFLCQCITQIVVPHEANYIISKISECLGDHINKIKLNEIKNDIKVCPSCLYDLKLLAQLKQNTVTFESNKKKCSLCYTKEDLIHINTFYHFDRAIQHITPTKVSKACLCLACIKYLDLLKKTIQGLLKIFPRLFTIESKQNIYKVKMKESNKSIRLRSSQPPVKLWTAGQKIEKHDVNNINLALKHLKPLKDLRYNVNQYKRDRKLYEKIAFVKLEIPKDAVQDEILQTNSINTAFTSVSSDKPTKKRALTKTVKRRKTTRKMSSKLELYVNLLRIDPVIKEEPIDNSDTEDCFTPVKDTNEVDCSIRSRKSVSFSDVLSVETKEQKKHNVDGTPLKSLLKSHRSLAISFMDSTNNFEDKPSGNDIINSDSDHSDNYTNSAETQPELKKDTEQKPDTTEDECMLDSVISNYEDICEKEQTGVILKSESNAEKQLLMNVTKSPDSSNNLYLNTNSNDTEVANEGSEHFVLELSDNDENFEKSEENEVSSTSPEKSVPCISTNVIINSEINTVSSHIENLLSESSDTSTENNECSNEINESQPVMTTPDEDVPEITMVIEAISNGENNSSSSEGKESKVEISSIETFLNSERVELIFSNDEVMPPDEVLTDLGLGDFPKGIIDKEQLPIESELINESDQEVNVINNDNVNTSNKRGQSDEETNEPEAKKMKHNDDSNVHSNKEVTETVESEIIENNYFSEDSILKLDNCKESDISSLTKDIVDTMLDKLCS